MPNSWVKSIQEFYKDKKYSVPRKGSPEYDAIKLIQTKNKEMISSVPIPVVKETVKRVKKIVKEGSGIQEVV